MLFLLINHNTMNKLVLKWYSKLAITVFMATIPFFSAQGQLPDIGDPASQIVTPEEEYRLGKKLLRDIRKKLPVVEDLELNYYINNLGYHLVSSSPDIRFPFTFLIIDDGRINAFAMPGGIIAVNRGLIEMADNEAELAAVLAHEIAHVTQRHLARFYQQSKGVNLKTALGILAAAVLSSYSSQAGQAAFFGTLAANADSKLRFTRTNERDADRTGRTILAQAGYDTAAMQSFFKKLEQASLNDPDQVSEFLQTHPLTSSRITDNIRPTQPAQGGEKKTDSLDFQLTKSRLVGLSEPLPTLLARAKNLEKSQRPEMQYLRAISLLRNHQNKAARKLLQTSNPSRTQKLPFKLLEIRALIAEKKHQPAVAKAEALYADHSQNPAVLGLLTEARLQAGNPKSALQLLKRTEISLESWPQLLKLKAEAAEQSGSPAQSHEALAEYYYYRGDIPLTLEHIKLALKSTGISSVMRARLEQNKKDLEAVLKDKKNLANNSE